MKNNHSMKSRKSPRYKTYLCIFVPYSYDIFCFSLISVYKSVHVNMFTLVTQDRPHSFPTIRQHYHFRCWDYTVFKPFDNYSFSTKSLNSGTVWERFGMISYWNTTLLNTVKKHAFQTFFHHFSNVFYTNFNGCCVTRDTTSGPHQFHLHG